MIMIYSFKNVITKVNLQAYNKKLWYYTYDSSKKKHINELHVLTMIDMLLKTYSLHSDRISSSKYSHWN